MSVLVNGIRLLAAFDATCAISSLCSSSARLLHIHNDGISRVKIVAETNGGPVEGYVDVFVVDSLPLAYDVVFGTDLLHVIPLMQSLLPSASFVDSGKSFLLTACFCNVLIISDSSFYCSCKYFLVFE